MAWIVDDIEDKIQSAMGIDQLYSLRIMKMYCDSNVSNEFFNFFICHDLPDNGLEKLILDDFKSPCFPLEEDVVSRMVNICTYLTTLQLSKMYMLNDQAKF